MRRHLDGRARLQARLYRDVLRVRPGFVKEHLKRLVAAGIQPHFMIGSVIKDLETVERIVRQGQYMGPCAELGLHRGGHDGPNPRNLMEFINRVPQNAC